jgi:hypothetical protein
MASTSVKGISNPLASGSLGAPGRSCYDVGSRKLLFSPLAPYQQSSHS